MPQPKPPGDDSETTSKEQEILEYQVRPSALVVDDSVDIAFMLAMILQHAGYNAVMSVSAREALALAQREHFDLVISDIGMPQMDGYAFAQRLRALSGYATVPMIAVTGFAEYDDRDRALAAGFTTHVKKPVDPASLVELIRSLHS